MLKYVQKVFDRMKLFLSGISANRDKWATYPENESTVQGYMDELERREKEIAELKNQVAAKQMDLRAYVSVMEEKIDRLEDTVRSIHATEKSKWLEYGVQVEREQAASTSPAMPLTLTIKDDTDGVGFVLSLMKADTDAYLYAWEKGTSSDPKATQPDKFEPFRDSTKISIVDDDVQPGVRYFYRVQSFNSKGYGPESNVVSRVQ